MDYNTGRSPIKLREYGRNVQRMVAHLKSVDDKEKRNSYAATLVELMKQINPNLKDTQEYEQKIWDDLHIISDFELDIEGPFPKPDATLLSKKPDRVGYNHNNIKFRHYGRSIEILIDQAIKLEDPAEKEGAIITIGRLMKSFFGTWNKENIEDQQVLKNIKALSGDELDIDIEKVKELRLFDMSKPAHDGNRNRRNNNNNRGKGRRGNNNNNNRSRRRNN